MSRAKEHKSIEKCIVCIKTKHCVSSRTSDRDRRIARKRYVLNYFFSIFSLIILHIIINISKWVQNINIFFLWNSVREVWYFASKVAIISLSALVVREVRYFASKVAIISLSALVVRKVTGSEIIGCSARKAMRKVPGDAQRAARGRRKSGEERGRGGGSHQGRTSSLNWARARQSAAV